MEQAISLTCRGIVEADEAQKFASDRDEVKVLVNYCGGKVDGIRM